MFWWEKQYHSILTSAVDGHIKRERSEGIDRRCYWLYKPSTETEFGEIRSVPDAEVDAYRQAGWHLVCPEHISPAHTRDKLLHDLRQMARSLPLIPTTANTN